mgnify:CR=1 FL=1
MTNDCLEDEGYDKRAGVWSVDDRSESSVQIVTMTVMMIKMMMVMMMVVVVVAPIVFMNN